MSRLPTSPGGTVIISSRKRHTDCRRDRNSGAISSDISYYSYFYNGATLTNSGTIDFQGDGGFYIGSGSPTVTNNGLIEKSAGGGNGGLQVRPEEQRVGQEQVQSGSVLLEQITATGATLSVPYGANMFAYYA